MTTPRPMPALSSLLEPVLSSHLFPSSSSLQHKNGS
ncbi:hypothetical protein Nmel_017903 [Mimus melanotis]